MEYELYEMELISDLNETLVFIDKQLSRISTSGANPQLINNLNILYYDELTPIGELSSITIPEPQQLLVKPFDKETSKDIYKMIEKQNYSISLVDEGHQIRIIFPLLTTDKRRESVKQLSVAKEAAKVKVRNARQAVLKLMKSDEELSEDVLNDFKINVQKSVDHYNGLIDKKIKDKEIELMKL
jgi:ribosome recycling factor